MSGFYPPIYGRQPEAASAATRQPNYAAAMGRIQTMTKDQLQELLDSEAKADEFIKSLEQIKALYAEKEMLMASNRSLAEYNLNQEPNLRESRNKLQERHRDTVRLTEKVRLLKSEVDAKAGQMDSETLLALLQAAGAEAEEQSEAVAERYLRKDIDSVDQFLEEFMEKRQLSHLRRIKIDKMKELLERDSGARATPTRPAPARPEASSQSRTPTMPFAYAPPTSVPGWAGMPPSYPPPAASGTASASNLPYPIHPTGMPSGPGY